MVAKIKFCGMMRSGAASVVADAGAAHLGVVFARGQRIDTEDGARQVVAAAAGAPVWSPLL